MTAPALARGDDVLPMLGLAPDPQRLLTRWRNTDAHTRGMSEVSFAVRDGQLVIRVTAVGPDGPIDWGEAPAHLFTDISVTGGGRAAASPTIDGQPTPHFADLSATDGGPAFWATYDHGFMTVHLQGRFNIGILPIVVFAEFTDGSGRRDYLIREVFIR